MEQDGSQSYFVINGDVSREVIQELEINYQVCEIGVNNFYCYTDFEMKNTDRQ